ncbi:amino acid ABC transporter permease [Meridianimarinicoccus sp. RP-17]|uniref:amino acid ABC transporter permease n=1 Tax=Meridianimarinicoccus zhengii TaxID=2056810 RepID=UPI000DABBE73|nr:amino acid ABC transporter permease [Phycocomes zhengii]
MDYTWDFGSVFMYREALYTGLVGTLRIFVICLISGLSLGLAVGLARYSVRRALRWPAAAFIEFFRNTPVLVQIFWFYFAFPILAPFDIAPLTAAALGITLNSAAFSAEIFRGGIQSIDPGQWEAGRAIGMRHRDIMRRIVLPQAIRRMLPALTNRGIEIFKMTTLASAIAYAELLHQARLIASINYNPIEAYTVVALAFFAILYPIVRATYALERRMARGD